MARLSVSLSALLLVGVLCTARAAEFDCALYVTRCVDTSISPAYADCAGSLAANPDAVNGALSCRQNHLELAASDAALHCPHASEAGTGGPCETSEVLNAPATSTDAPTDAPTGASTDAPTVTSTGAPTGAPTMGTMAPTVTTMAPTASPTEGPTATHHPTAAPTGAPTCSGVTCAPTASPTGAPTTTMSPTMSAASSVSVFGIAALVALVSAMVML